MAKLRDKQERFCHEYVIDLNGTQAAIRAGYSEKTANSIASEMLTKPYIQARIAEIKAPALEKLNVDADYVLRRLVEIDSMDVADILDDNMVFKPLKEWPQVWRRYLSGIDIAEVFSGSGDAKELAGVLKKIKWPDKVKNLELLGKHIKVAAFSDKVDHTSSDGTMSPAKPTREDILAAQKLIADELSGLD